MDALQQMMNNPWNRTRDFKKRWRTVCRNDTRASAGAQQHQGLVAYMRPQTWMLQPLDLSTDVVTMIVEALMCSDDLNKARTIKALALVNRLYAAAVAFTLNQVRAQLQRNANDLALVQKRQLMLNRACVDGESVGEEAHAHIAAEVIRRNGVHCQYMTSVGIPSKRRGTLLRFADRTRFHDNRSLLGHMEGGCELCGNPHGRMATGDAFIRDGPVVLVACEECKGKHCVNLTLQYADETGELLKVNIEQEETEANNYARALLGKQSAHRKRMCSKRASRMSPAKLGKRVHRIGVTEELSLCYWTSSHLMSQGPWMLELWHTLPKALPQNLTFGALTGVRNSEAVREEAHRHAERLHVVRAKAAHKRIALKRLMRTHEAARKQVALVVRVGHFEGWCQAIDLCTAARAFGARWMFRNYEGPGAIPADWRASRYKLLAMDQDKLCASVRRVATVAQVLRRGLFRASLPAAHHQQKTTERDVMLQLMRNFPVKFLQGTVGKVDEIVDVVLRAPVELTLSSPSRLVVTYALGGRFAGRRMAVSSYITRFTARRICSALPCCPPKQTIEQSVLDELQCYANRSACVSPQARAIRNQTRSAIFALPALWPEWLTA